MSIRVALEHRTTYRSTARSRSGRTWSACGRRRTAARRSWPTRCGSTPERALPELAAGSVRQLPRAARLPGARRRELTVTVDLVADMTVINPFDFFVEESPSTCPFATTRPDARPRARTSSREPAGPLLDALGRRGRRGAASTAIDRLPGRPQPARAGDVAYSMRMEPGVQPPDETLRRGIGSCRDSAWLLVQILRQLGLAARFVVRLPRPARRRRSRSTDRPARRGLHRPARLGRGLHPRRRLDRPRPHVRAARRRGPHPARVHAAPVAPPRRSPASTEPGPRSTSTSPTCPAPARGPARHHAVHARRSGSAIDALGATVDARAARPATFG